MATPTSPRKILTIDDEQAIVDLIRDILEQDHFEVLRATKWTEALDALAHKKPDLILLDLKMPTINGATLLEFIRDEGIQVPVIVVSGYITEEVTAELSAQGVSSFIRKPFKASVLKAEITQALGLDQAPPQSEVPIPVSERSSLDALYNQPPGTVPEPGTPSQTVTPVTMDALYGAPSDAPPYVGKTTRGSLNEEEAVQILGKLGKAPQPASESASEAPAQSEKSRASDPGPQKELLAALNKLDTEKADTKTPVPPAPPASASAQAEQIPVAPAQSPQETRPSHKGSAPVLESPFGPEPTGAREKPQDPFLQSYRPPPPPPKRRHRVGRSNWIFMGVITFVCVLVTGFLVLAQWYASQVDLEDMSAKAQKSMIKQEAKSILEELKKQQK